MVLRRSFHQSTSTCRSPSPTCIRSRGSTPSSCTDSSSSSPIVHRFTRLCRHLPPAPYRRPAELAVDSSTYETVSRKARPRVQLKSSTAAMQPTGHRYPGCPSISPRYLNGNDMMWVCLKLGHFSACLAEASKSVSCVLGPRG